MAQQGNKLAVKIKISLFIYRMCHFEVILPKVSYDFLTNSLWVVAN